MTQLSAGAEVPLPEPGLYIDGSRREAADGSDLTVINPATEQALATVAAAGPEDVDAAVGAARRELEGGRWSRLTGVERGRLLTRLADLVERDTEVLAGIEALEVGRPVAEPRSVDVPNAAETFRHFAGWADKLAGSQIPVPPLAGAPRLSYTVRGPVGVVAAITPWNAPTMIASWKLAPALACGCTVVLKPPAEAPLSALHLAGLAEEAGFPPGVLNVLPGHGDAGAALVRHPGTDKISFTGSTEVGRDIARAAADRFKRVTLELGGKSPQIVCADADLERALPVAAISLFANQGEICAAGTRVLVDRRILDRVVSGLGAEAARIRVGDPFDAETTMGALVSERQLQRVLGYVAAGLEEGAELVHGGGRLERPGYFVEPTVFVGHNELRIAQEEIFGPVGTVVPFDGLDQAIELANGTRYGLTSVVWTQDIGRAHALASRLRAGSVWVNSWGPPDPRLPWGGVKQSGVGRELGWSGIEAHTEEKLVNVVL